MVNSSKDVPLSMAPRNCTSGVSKASINVRTNGSGEMSL